MWILKETHHNLWDCAKAILRRKFIELNGYIWKKETVPYQWAQFLSYKTQEKEQIKLKITRRKYIIKIKGEKQNTMKQEGKKKQLRKINETKYCFFEKFNKIDKSLPSLIGGRGRRHKLPITEMNDMTDSTDYKDK